MFKIGDEVRAKYEAHRLTYGIDTGIIVGTSFSNFIVKFSGYDLNVNFSPQNLVLVNRKSKIPSRPWK